MGSKEFNSDHYGPVWRWAALDNRFSKRVSGAAPCARIFLQLGNKAATQPGLPRSLSIMLSQLTRAAMHRKAVDGSSADRPCKELTTCINTKATD
jgi:hypothetical protein